MTDFKKEFVVVSATDVTDSKWLRGQPMPLDNSLKICEMFLVAGESKEAGSVKIFALPKLGPPTEDTLGTVVTMRSPIIRLIAMLGPKRKWEEELEEIDEDLIVDEAVDLRGQTWRVGGDVPEDGSAGFVIERVVHGEDGVWVYANPPKQSGWAKNNLALKFILPSFTFASAQGSYSFEAWGRMLKEWEASDDDVEPEPEPEPVPSMEDMANEPSETATTTTPETPATNGAVS